MEQELPLQSDSNTKTNRETNHVMLSHPWIRLLLIGTTVKSILGLIILFLLLIVSIVVLAVGCLFRQSQHCLIEPRLSLFLIIAGIGSIEWIILSIILSTITIVLPYIRSFFLAVFIIFIASIILIINLFLFVWVICGSVWTLQVLDTVQYKTPDKNTYCQRTLHHFTLGYLILTYVLTALQCWYRLCTIVFCSVK
ncbi:unnamed protein product [Adineta steineri]|uniref:Uncharacterized protein n=1 Tax=Adineta steineri TaxID=433720 RepID=A0A814BBV9_9BILA|nr:unnamed protein product [Adineta steineri]CAF0949064.1 unnamed protein product [Adineta steineri]CAF1004724.1 unnamed protein product [Adineta steineri]CAF3533315.1 unnamed protein product [Adineta steineri]CAF3619022.1 unnamed protein product [Adineta steineri]